MIVRSLRRSSMVDKAEFQAIRYACMRYVRLQGKVNSNSTLEDN